MAVDRWIPRHPTSWGDSRPYIAMVEVNIGVFTEYMVVRCLQWKAPCSLNSSLFMPDSQCNDVSMNVSWTSCRVSVLPYETAETRHVLGTKH